MLDPIIKTIEVPCDWWLKKCVRRYTYCVSNRPIRPRSVIAMPPPVWNVARLSDLRLRMPDSESQATGHFQPAAA